MVLNKNLQVRPSHPSTSPVATRQHLTWSRDGQEINIQNMNVELVAQMFKNYQSNVLFHLEGGSWLGSAGLRRRRTDTADHSHRQLEGSLMTA